jgi:hypothetical protein
LPPGAEREPTAPVSLPKRARAADALLPQGAETVDSAAAPGAQLPIPAAPQRLPQPVKTAPGTAAIPTADGGYVTIHESPKVIGSGDDEIEVRRLAPEEKASRRLRKGLILWTICVAILAFVMWLFVRGG